MTILVMPFIHSRTFGRVRKKFTRPRREKMTEAAIRAASVFLFPGRSDASGEKPPGHGGSIS